MGIYDDLSDINHNWGEDIRLSATGDLGQVQLTERGVQRVLRRLLTNPGDYIFHPEYGAGLPAQVGETLDLSRVRSIIRGQMLLESAVAKSPGPQIVLSEIPNGVAVQITYTDAVTQKPVILSFNVEA